MNILLTNTCSRRCAYCFAQERVTLQSGKPALRAAPPHIAFDDFGAALTFAKTGPPEVGILGGEPSLHPRFVDLLEAAWEAGLHTKIFSNGMWRPDDLETLASREFPGPRGPRFHVVMNMNEPDRTPAHEQEAQALLLERLGERVTLSFNISRIDFDPRFLVDAILKYRIRRHIRLGVAQPLAEIENEHVPVADYPKLAPTLLALAEQCDAHDIQLGFDCGFTLCMFTPEQHGQLLLTGARFRASCGPTLDIGTDLSAWACFPLSTFSKGVTIGNYPTMEALARYFDEQFRRLYRTGALPECVECRYRRRGQCAGGCAAHVYRAVSA
jgi:sulfatase maturation enzyme AslB (radical SAM superfamily)